MSSKKTPRNTQEFVDYRIAEAETKIDTVQATVDKLNDKLDTNFATKDYVDGQVKPLRLAIESLLDDRKWLIRLLIGFVITSILYVVFQVKVGH